MNRQSKQLAIRTQTRAIKYQLVSEMEEEAGTYEGTNSIAIRNLGNGSHIYISGQFLGCCYYTTLFGCHVIYSIISLYSYSIQLVPLVASGPSARVPCLESFQRAKFARSRLTEQFGDFLLEPRITRTRCIPRFSFHSHNSPSTAGTHTSARAAAGPRSQRQQPSLHREKEARRAIINCKAAVLTHSIEANPYVGNVMHMRPSEVR